MTTTPDLSRLTISTHAIPRKSSPSSPFQYERQLERSNYQNGSSQNAGEVTKKKEVFRFKANWLISSTAWSNESGEPLKLALCSYIEDYSNCVQIIQLAKDSNDQEIESICTFDHPYPATKVLWIPQPPECKANLPHLIATTADYLRLWRVTDAIGETCSKIDGITSPSEGISSDLNGHHNHSRVRLECLLDINKGTKHCAPLTSFDWNDIDPRMIVTSSVDTTCAIWDIETGQQVAESLIQSPIYNKSLSCSLRSLIVAHDHEVYDVSFSRSGSGRDMFASAGGDGSIRLFDLRRLNTSTILYEVDRSFSSDGNALVRVACNKLDSNFVSAFATNSKDVLILDVRKPGRQVAILSSHTAEVNCMSWAPHSAHYICTASDDQQALIWKLSTLPSPVDEPLLAYRANGKINTISWSTSHPDWIAIGYNDCLELLRV